MDQDKARHKYRHRASLDQSGEKYVILLILMNRDWLRFSPLDLIHIFALKVNTSVGSPNTLPIGDTAVLTELYLVKSCMP